MLGDTGGAGVPDWLAVRTDLPVARPPVSFLPPLAAPPSAYLDLARALAGR
jgi:hypothetical protein